MGTHGVGRKQGKAVDRKEPASSLAPAAKKAKKQLEALFDRALSESRQPHSNLERGTSFRSDKPADHLREMALDVASLGTGTAAQDAVGLKALLDQFPREPGSFVKSTYALSTHFTAKELTQIDQLVHDFADARGLTKELGRLNYPEPWPVEGSTRLDQSVAAGYTTKKEGTRWRG